MARLPEPSCTSVARHGALVVDLGCGPGYSTRLLAEVLQGTHTVGLDNSAHFIALAQQNLLAQVAFHCHDVEQVPFPVLLPMSSFVAYS